MVLLHANITNKEMALKILVAIDRKPASAAALHAAAQLSERLSAELAVITVRPGTHAAESPAPVGVTIPAGDRMSLPEGIQILLQAADALAASGFLAPVSQIKLRDLPHGHVFVAPKATGERLLFCERFGSLVDELNHEIAESQFDLVVIAAPRRGPLGRFAPMNIPRKLALDLHCSFLVVRGGMPDGRYLVCADGSPSSRRIFPFLRRLLPSIRGPIELVCVQKPIPDPKEVAQAEHCLTLASAWLTRCGKTIRVRRLQGAKRFQVILDAAGGDAIIVMGESHMHDVRRRTLGTLPLKVLPRTDASFLMVKQPTEPDPEMFEESFSCE
jgi:nucleotide-binding universal stress UspA family protein